jgi:GNAT superfamily N-acetyltransferase
LNKSSNQLKILIRDATPNDILGILNFIRELAEFEKLLDQVEVTKEKFRKTLFGKKPFAKVLIAEIKGRSVGFLLYFNNYSTFLGKPGIYIEDIYIKPKYRNRGVGKEFMKYCAKLAKEHGYGRIEWAALTWNPARKFYEKLGAKPLNDWILYRLTGKKLKDFADS